MADYPLPALLYRLNQNINAVCAAVEELAIWVEQRGSTETSAAMKAQLNVLIENSDFIAEALADLVAKDG